MAPCSILLVPLRTDKKASQHSAWLNRRSISCMYRPSRIREVQRDRAPTGRKPAIPSFSRCFLPLPPFSQVRSVCPGYTSTRQTVTHSSVREALMVCFQSSSGTCSEGRAQVYRSCLQTRQRIVSIVLCVKGVGRFTNRDGKEGLLVVPCFIPTGPQVRPMSILRSPDSPHTRGSTSRPPPTQPRLLRILLIGPEVQLLDMVDKSRRHPRTSLRLFFVSGQSG